MGASIHMHIEVKAGDTWHHYAAPHMFRNRDFFDLVAGVYGRHQPIVPPRGLPENPTFVTRHDYEQDSKGCRLHHTGWLGADELEELQQRINEVFHVSNVDSMEYELETGILHTFINGNTLAQHQGWDDLRLIFWFDN